MRRSNLHRSSDRLAKGAFLAAAAALTTGAGPAPVRPADLAGAYHRHVQDALMNGQEYGAEDVLEVVPTSPTATYVRTLLNFGNGHTCAISAVFDVVGAELVYHDPQETQCVLRLRAKGGRIEFDDGRETCQTYCGARGSWEGEGFPLTARRPITYMRRLLGSSEYKAAMAEHASHGRRR